MRRPVVTIQCMHQCPQSDGDRPHVGGPVVTGSNNVFVASRSVSRIGDSLQCNSPSVAKISSGSTSVYVNGMAVALLNSQTSHGGAIIEGNNSVFTK